MGTNSWIVSLLFVAVISLFPHWLVGCAALGAALGWGVVVLWQQHQRHLALIAKIKAMESGTERTALAMEVLGRTLGHALLLKLEGQALDRRERQERLRSGKVVDLSRWRKSS